MRRQLVINFRCCYSAKELHEICRRAADSPLLSYAVECNMLFRKTRYVGHTRFFAAKNTFLTQKSANT